MPWFPEFSTPRTFGSDVQSRPRHLLPFYEGLLGPEPEALLSSWGGEPHLDDPRAGRIEGSEAFLAWGRQTRQWLTDADAAVRPVFLIVTPMRTVEEVALDLTLDSERRELPVAIVAERNSDGRLTTIRVYHSLWPLIEAHEVRPPLLSRDSDLTPPDVIGDYQRALAAGDLEGILVTYEENAVVREPAGGPYVYTGKDNLRRIYSLQFADGAGIPLEWCAITDDGTACALEYNAVQWGKTPIPPQAGIAVYQRGVSGKLGQGRIYDDVAPPAASDSSRQ